MLDAAGHAASPEGIMWVNYWWARGSHLMTIVRPTVSKDRMYYEWWLSKKVVDDLIPTSKFAFPLHSIAGLQESGWTNRVQNNSMSLCLPEWRRGTTFTQDQIIISPLWHGR